MKPPTKAEQHRNEMADLHWRVRKHLGLSQRAYGLLMGRNNMAISKLEAPAHNKQILKLNNVHWWAAIGLLRTAKAQGSDAAGLELVKEIRDTAIIVPKAGKARKVKT